LVSRKPGVQITRLYLHPLRPLADEPTSYLLACRLGTAI